VVSRRAKQDAMKRLAAWMKCRHDDRSIMKNARRDKPGGRFSERMLTNQ